MHVCSSTSSLIMRQDGTLCARAYGAPAIRGSITDSYLSFLPTRVH
jgi:hypothetical protein